MAILQGSFQLTPLQCIVSCDERSVTSSFFPSKKYRHKNLKNTKKTSSLTIPVDEKLKDASIIPQKSLVILSGRDHQPSFALSEFESLSIGLTSSLGGLADKDMSNLREPLLDSYM